MNRLMNVRTVVLMLLTIGLLGVQALAGEVNQWRAAAEQGNIRLEARYAEDLENGLVDQFLEVRLDNLALNTTFTVSLTGRAIGRFTTDGNGSGRFTLEALDVEADENGRPLGPRIDTGDEITVSRGRHALTATFVPD